KHDRRVARIGVCGAVTLVIAEEDLADRAVGISADRAGVTEAGDFKVEGFGQTAVRQTLASGMNHCASPRRILRVRTTKPGRSFSVLRQRLPLGSYNSTWWDDGLRAADGQLVSGGGRTIASCSVTKRRRSPIFLNRCR